MHAGRAAGIGRGEALLAALALLVVADHEVALDDIDLFPVVVHERLGRERAGVDLEQARAAALLLLLVQVGGEDLLPEARRIAFRALPAAVDVDLHEFQVLFRLHAASCFRYSMSATARSPEATSWAASERSARKRFASSVSNSTSLMRR